MKYIKNFESLNDDILYYIEKNDIESILKLIKTGVDINYLDTSNVTPYLFALINNKNYIASMLLKNGADINRKLRNGQTALIIESYNSNIRLVRKIINDGADWNIIDDNGKDFLDYLSSEHRSIIIKEYLDEYKKYLIKKDSLKYNL